MVHVKLKGMMNSATCKHIFCLFTPPRPLGEVKIISLLIAVIFHIDSMGMEHRAQCKHIITSTKYRPIPSLNFLAKLFDKLVLIFAPLLTLNISIMIFKTTICYRLWNQASFQATQLLTNLHIYTIYSLKHLMLVMRYRLSYVTSARPLIVYGMKVLFTNLTLLVFQGTS